MKVIPRAVIAIRPINGPINPGDDIADISIAAGIEHFAGDDSGVRRDASGPGVNAVSSDDSRNVAAVAVIIKWIVVVVNEIFAAQVTGAQFGMVIVVAAVQHDDLAAMAGEADVLRAAGKHLGVRCEIHRLNPDVLNES